MTLAQLANFVCIAELRSLSKAAAVIRIAQPALSRQIRNLESELGSPLLVRHAWGVTLTPSGEVLLESARRVIVEAEAARDAVAALAAEPTGNVEFGVPTSVAIALIPPLATRISKRYPRVRVHFVDGFSAMLHQRSIRGELDLAVLYEDRAIGPLATAPLLMENLMLVGSPDATLESDTASNMLTGNPLVLPARPNRLRLIVDHALAQTPIGESAVMEVDSLTAILGIVQRGTGFTVLPYSAVASEVEKGLLRVWDLQFPQLSRTLLLVRPLDRQPTAAVIAVEKEIRALVTSRANELRWKPLDGGPNAEPLQA